MLLFLCQFGFSQNVGINTTGAAPAATNFLEVLSPSSTVNSIAIYGAHSGVVAGTGYGIWIEKTGASTTNVAAYYSASGATNNYAIIVPSGGGNVGIGTSTPSSKAALDVSSTTQGVLVPRMTKVQRDAITSPTTSLLVYVSDGSPVGFYYYTGSAWVPLVSTITYSTSSPTIVTYAGQAIMVHTADYSGTLAWDDTAYGVTSATSSTNGQTNVATLTAIDITKFPAAYYCDTLTAYGYTDWYLPSSSELAFLNNSAVSLVGFNNGAAGFWSSTETADLNSVSSQPKRVNFSAPNTTSWVWASQEATNDVKTSGRRCRCIRKP